MNSTLCRGITDLTSMHKTLKRYIGQCSPGSWKRAPNMTSYLGAHVVRAKMKYHIMGAGKHEGLRKRYGEEMLEAIARATEVRVVVETYEAREQKRLDWERNEEKAQERARKKREEQQLYEMQARSPPRRDRRAPPTPPPMPPVLQPRPPMLPPPEHVRGTTIVAKARTPAPPTSKSSSSSGPLAIPVSSVQIEPIAVPINATVSALLPPGQGAKVSFFGFSRAVLVCSSASCHIRCRWGWPVWPFCCSLLMFLGACLAPTDPR